MDILIPLTIVVVVLVWSVKRFKPELWSKAVALFKK
jgi:hypothetical protein